ncbi:MAG TPA: alpha-isopropylmalate synthase regulatory domain-containing protein [Candidatus Dormibacteraeota bacterium]|nr:alpha-isopropylmalate synthase regulatory domain-containing protein [Candidatus Dormibacteraeota bacterium]
MDALTTEPTADAVPTLHLVRWTVTSGSNINSRGAVVLSSGGHQWQATAEGNGPIAALYAAVDRAMAEVLEGHPRLLAFDVHALAEGPDAEGEVRVRLAPPGGQGARSAGEYSGAARSTNIVAASIDAYIAALCRLLGEEQWAGAAESAGERRGQAAAAQGARAHLDEAAGRIDTTEWFNPSSDRRP